MSYKQKKVPARFGGPETLIDWIETLFFVSSLKSRCGLKKTHRKILKKFGRKNILKISPKNIFEIFENHEVILYEKNQRFFFSYKIT